MIRAWAVCQKRTWVEDAGKSMSDPKTHLVWYNASIARHWFWLMRLSPALPCSNALKGVDTLAAAVLRLPNFKVSMAACFLVATRNQIHPGAPCYRQPKGHIVAGPTEKL